MKFTPILDWITCLENKNILTGKSERYARYLIKKMKEHYLKEPHHYITIKEFCDYLGLDVDEVEERLF